MPIAIAGIGAVLVALLAALIIFAAAGLARMLSGFMPDIHVPILGNLRSLVLHAAESAIQAVGNWANHAASALANWVLAPFHLLNVLVGELAGAVTAVYHGALKVKALAQHLYNLAVRYAAHAALTVLHYAQHLYNLAVRYAELAAESVLHSAQHLYNLAVEYAEHAAEVVLHDAQHLYNLEVARAVAAEEALLHDAQHLYNLAVADTARSVAAAERYALGVAEASAAAAVGVLSTDIGHVAERAWVEITDDVRALEGVIATDLPDIGALVRAIPAAIPADLAAVITGVLAIDQVAVRYLRECGIPNCRNLGGFGRALQDLFKLAEGAGLLAFLIAMVDDPSGAVTETVDTLDTLTTDTIGGLRHLLGV